MKPAPFHYHAPESVADALALLAEHGDDAKPLAGGQSLVPMLALRLTRFEHLVDLGRVGGLRGIERADGVVTVRAMTRQRDVERSPEIAVAVPLLARATPLIGHFQIRNRGTVGGSLAHADPASEYPAVAVALGAELEVAGSTGARRVPAHGFFEGTWTTCMNFGELLVAAHFPVWSGRCGFAVEEVARRHGDFALAGAACAVEVDASGRVARAGLALFGVGPMPVRAASVESALVGSESDRVDAIELGALAASELDPPGDLHASPATRRRIAAHVVTRALRRALEEASG